MGDIDLRDRTDGTAARVADAALRCVARWGLAKTTLEDVAREAGCSRATLYRAFPGGKEAVLATVADLELRRLEGAVAIAVAAADDLEDVLVASIIGVAGHLEGHAAFQFLLAHEPGLVLPHLAFHELDALLARVRAFGGPLLEPYLDAEDAGRVAEWVGRIVISYLCSPAVGVRLTDDTSVRRLVRSFVLPGLSVPAAS